MSAALSLLSIIIGVNFVLSGVVAWRLWLLRKETGRLGKYLLVYFILCVISSIITIYARRDVIGMEFPPGYELKRAIGAAVFAVGQSALALHLLGLKK